MDRAAHRRFKDAIYEQLARVGKAAANPVRLELLDLLCQAPRTVEALAAQTGQSVANVSQHLQVLKAARLVATEKDGVYVTYRLADARVALFFHELRGLARARLPEIEHVTRAFLDDDAALEAVDRETLIKRVRAGHVTLIDVRPAEEYRAGHIPGAISVPIDELKGRLAKLPKSRTIVAYCRGPYCVFAMDAVKVLRARGFEAVRLDEGIADWRARGFRVETSRAEGRA